MDGACYDPVHPEEDTAERPQLPPASEYPAACGGTWNRLGADATTQRSSRSASNSALELADLDARLNRGMKLTFIGTRGNIEARNRRHARHSSLLVEYEDHRVMIDCGEDWRGRWEGLDPEAIFITHAHPDHAWGLKDGALAPVYATSQSWDEMSSYDIARKEELIPRKPVRIGGIEFTGYPVDHSIRAPAVGYRVRAGDALFFYVPDVVFIPDEEQALESIDLYVGDGASLNRSLVRKTGEALVGHTPIRTQLTWCERNQVSRALFTHCGSQIVRGDERSLRPRLQKMGREKRVEARIAHDGMEVILR